MLFPFLLHIYLLMEHFKYKEKSLITLPTTTETIIPKDNVILEVQQKESSSWFTKKNIIIGMCCVSVIIVALVCYKSGLFSLP